MARPGRKPRHGTHRSGTVSVGAYLPSEIRDRLRAAAAKEGTTLAGLVRAVLVAWATGDPLPPPPTTE
jgi:hypothetical protein